jgi:hypothetical protein
LFTRSLVPSEGIKGEETRRWEKGVVAAVMTPRRQRSPNQVHE